ncbi:hypothetical protein PZ938_16115 [Luteipulveratus sp. YIM 133132]|uniref:hypothetical protein n=1 Tax=Luteipulveratus flavus TaxID=3031728 RepID=UPI0023B005E7|nr:hypothetical protein [Luteipulveratus sp. YIM 133132]MDE9367144.1 hypothetical protein [Luteipulveratus sp. YIM 133132]
MSTPEHLQPRSDDGHDPDRVQDTTPTDAAVGTEETSPVPEPTTHDQPAAATSDDVPPAPPAPPEQRWISGPSPLTAVVGAILLAIAGLSIAVETQDWDPSWTIVLPAAVVGIGLLLALAGLVAAVRRTTD